MRLFEFDFDRWLALMLPTFLRRPRIFGFCRAMTVPVRWIYEEFRELRGEHLLVATHTGQVCYMRHALNSAFGLTRGFEIEDADGYEGKWLYAKDQSMARQLYAVDETLNADIGDGDSALPEHPTPLLADEARLNLSSDTFIVYVPGDIYRTRLKKVKSIVEQLRIVTKKPIYQQISI